MKLTILLSLMLCSFFNVEAQVEPDFFLNEGEVFNNPVYVATKKMLVCSPANGDAIVQASGVTIWDVDRASVLKKISLGDDFNQLTVSAAENFITLNLKGSTKIFDLNKLQFVFDYPADSVAEFRDEFYFPHFFHHDSVFLFKNHGDYFYIYTANWQKIYPFKSEVSFKDVQSSYGQIYFSENRISVSDNGHYKIIEIPRGDVITDRDVANGSGFPEILPFKDLNTILVYSLVHHSVFALNAITGQASNHVDIHFQVGRNTMYLLPSGKSAVLADDYRQGKSLENGYRILKLDYDTNVLTGTEYQFEHITELRSFSYIHIKFTDNFAALLDYDHNSLGTINFKTNKQLLFHEESPIYSLEPIDSNLLTYKYGGSITDDSIKLKVVNTGSGKHNTFGYPYPYTIAGISSAAGFNLIERRGQGLFALVKYNEDLLKNDYRYFRNDFEKLWINGLTCVNSTVVASINSAEFGHLPDFVNTRIITLNTGNGHVQMSTMPIEQARLFYKDAFFTWTTSNTKSMYGTVIDSVFLWDTQTQKIIFSTTLDEYQKELHNDFYPYGAELTYGRTKNQILFSDATGYGVFNISDHAIHKVFYKPKNSLILNQVSFCNNYNHIVLSGLNESIVCDAITGDSIMVNSLAQNGDVDDEYHYSRLDSRYMVNSAAKKTIEVKDFKNPNFSRKIAYEPFHLAHSYSVGFSDSAGMYYICNQPSGKLTVYESLSGKSINAKDIEPTFGFNGGFTDKTSIVYFTEKGIPQLWNFRKNTSQSFSTNLEPGKVNSSIFIPSKNLLASTGFNNIYLWDLKSLKLKDRLIVTDTSSYLLINEAGFYTGPKSVFPKIRVLLGNRVFPPEQLDLYYNRPFMFIDTGIAELKGLYVAEKDAYQKRLRKMGVSGLGASDFLNIPKISIENRDSIAGVYETPLCNFVVDAQDEKNHIARINVFDNGIPVFGMRGISVKGDPALSVKQKIAVPLTVGDNSIQVSCVNEKGVESYKETFYIRYYPKDRTTKHDLYIIAIGVSKYLDDRYNLQYSVKDGRDLCALFKSYEGKGETRHVYVDSFFENQATREKILAIKNKLLKTGVDDEVVLSISGHGLLSSNMDFYYATYDMDFKIPEKRGLLYDELEALLDSIPARKKLLLMDACHSGEVDKEDYQKNAPVAALAKGINVVYTGNSKGLKLAEPAPAEHEIGLQNSFELMQNLFANLNRGSGAQVISAAAGNSYAYENADWKNGVFTYSVINALKNADVSITVGKLREEVMRKVEELTAGRQKPTSRRENMDNDWNIW